MKNQHRHAFHIWVLRRLVAVLFLSSFAATAADATSPPIKCYDSTDGATEFYIPVFDSVSEQIEMALGLYAAPDAYPTHLVVIGHGAGHTIESWRDHAEMLANDYGYLVVAMEYRDMIRREGNEHFTDRHPDSLYHDGNAEPEDGHKLYRADGWPVRKGGEDLNAATRTFLNACPGIQNTVLAGISMGVSMTGWALAHEPLREDNTTPLYDYWLAIEGVHNLTESYFEDRAVNDSRPGANFTHTRFIEEEIGGGPYQSDGTRERVAYHEDPESYRERTNIRKTAEIAGAGLTRAIYVHAAYDAVVPYWQSRAMADTLPGVPFEFYTVTLRSKGDDGTVLEDYVLDPINDVYKDENIDPEAPLAGHAKESRGQHVVMRASFDRLADLIHNVDRQCGEYISYDTLDPSSPISSESSEVVSVPLPGQTYDCDAAPSRQAPDPSGGGKAKGSGWLPASDGKKINFSFKVDSDSDSDSDSDKDNKLSLRDKQAGVKIKIDDITAIGGIVGTCGSIEASPQALEFHGNGTYNGAPASFRVCVEDNGKGKKEPRDRFVLACLQGCSYSTSTRALDQLGGGNIKVYRSADGSEAPASTDPGEADVLFLNPLLEDEVLPGSVLPLEVIVINGNGQRLANALVELRLEYADGSSSSIAAATNVNGVALIPVQLTVNSVSVVATSGGSSSNWVAFSTAAQ